MPADNENLGQGPTGSVLDGMPVGMIPLDAEIHYRNRYRDLFQTISSGVAVFGPDPASGRMVFKDLNPAGERICKKAKDDLIGLSVADAYPLMASSGLLDKLHEVHRTGEEQPWPLTGHNDNGSWYHIENRIYRLPNGDVVAVFEDRTPEKRAELELSESREQLRRLTARLGTIEEEERKRLSREFHDQVGQKLSALGMTLAAIKSAHGPEPLHARDLLTEAMKLAKEATEQARNLVLEMRPSMLDDYGIYSALSWYGERFGERYGIAFDISMQGRFRRLPQDVETALYRIAQEAITNALKHSKASRISVGIGFEPEVHLTVSDDGVGFVVDPGHPRGFGLMIMRERALAVGGDLTIGSVPGGGTRITAVVPGGGMEWGSTWR